MRLTRRAVRRAIVRCRAYLDRARRIGARSRIAKVVPNVLRGRYSLNYRHADSILQAENVAFLEMDAAAAGRHWAETDGCSIWLSPLKRWTPDALYFTLLHEALHGLVRRKDGSELSEHREHVLMTMLDDRLVDDPKNPSPWL